jgi:hypothetical protein
MRIGLWSSVAAMALMLGFASGVSAKEKSWEIDIYEDDVDVTYIPDGRDDIHVYDHVEPWNDRSYIEVDRPRYRYRDHGRYDRYDRRDRYGYGGYSDHPRAYRYNPYGRPRYRVEYHHDRYRGW